MEKLEEAPKPCSYPSCAALAEADKPHGMCVAHRERLDFFIWALSHVNVQGRPLLKVIAGVAQSMNNAEAQALAAKLRPQLHSPNGGLLRR